MKNIKDINVTDKKVILRADLNVSIKDNIITSDSRIKASLKTINYLIDNNSKIILMSHLGKIKKEEDLNNNSLLIVYNRLKELLPNINIYFSNATTGEELETKINNLKNKEILLIENTRYEDLNNNKESNNNLELAKYWASLGDVFIDDAFGLTHRKHASNFGIKKYLPSAYGLLIEEELNKLNILLNPVNPYVVIMGGAKVEDKSSLINKLITKCDYLLLGGGIANTFLAVNYEVGSSLISEDYIQEAKDILIKYPNKIIMPVDVIVENNKVINTKDVKDVIKEDIIYDIGPKTINLYKDFINKAETIFMNGTAGLYENHNFELGTKSLLEICVSSKGKTIIGGGDALTSAEYFNIKDFYHLSTGGGATLNYISSEKLLSMEEINVNNT